MPGIITHFVWMTQTVAYVLSLCMHHTFLFFYLQLYKSVYRILFKGYEKQSWRQASMDLNGGDKLSFSAMTYFQCHFCNLIYPQELGWAVSG